MKCHMLFLKLRIEKIKIDQGWWKEYKISYVKVGTKRLFNHIIMGQLTYIKCHTAIHKEGRFEIVQFGW